MRSVFAHTSDRGILRLIGLALCALNGSGLTSLSAQGVQTPASVRDSAGVRIVRSVSPREHWTLNARPLASIGSASADSNLWFDGLANAARLRNGTFVVLNCADPLLRWFTADGRFLRGAGRTGDGPGEYGRGECRRVPQLWVLPGDSVATWEHSGRQMQVHDASGKYIRAVSLSSTPSIGGHPHFAGHFADGSFAVFTRPESPQVATGAIWQEKLSFHWYKRDGSYGGAIAQLPGLTFVQWEFTRPGGTVMRDVSARPFGLLGMFVVHGDRVYHFSGEQFEIDVYQRNGRKFQSIRRQVPSRPVTSAMIRTFRDQRSARYRNTPDVTSLNNMERILGAREFPANLPALRDLRVDLEGLLWVREYAHPADKIATWSIFDRGGELLAELTTPLALRVLDVGRSHLIGAITDSLGVEHVNLYSITSSRSR